MTEKQKVKSIRNQAKTIMSRLMELQSLDREYNTHLLPCSTKGYIQALTNVVMSE